MALTDKDRDILVEVIEGGRSLIAWINQEESHRKGTWAAADKLAASLERLNSYFLSAPKLTQ